MNHNFFEFDKKTLEQYYERLLRCHNDQRMSQLRFLWRFLHQASTFTTIVDDMKSKHEHYYTRANSFVGSPHGHALNEDHLDRVYLTYFIISLMIRDTSSSLLMSNLGSKYNTNKDNTVDQNFRVFIDLFLENFIFHILNQADKNNSILGLLRKYKHRTEWFDKQLLLLTISENPKQAERILKESLYKYLFDQGLSLFIEPYSPAGEIDIIALEENNSQKSLFEAKVFDGVKRTSAYIKKGFNQVLEYMRTHNEKIGYMVIYNSGSTLLTIKGELDNYFPFIKNNDIVVNFIIVDIYQNSSTASEGNSRHIVELKAEDFY